MSTHSTQPFSSYNPVSGATLWTGLPADAAHVDMAMQAAQQAFQVWRHTPFAERVQIAERFAELVTEQQDSLARLIAAETGKALWDARSEVAATAGKVALSIQAYEQRTGTQQQSTASHTRSLRHAPHGVVVVIGPFNFPAHLPNGHIVPALLAGNAVVFKPSEQAPAVAERLAQLWRAAGLPDKVLQVLNGAGATGQALVAHPLSVAVLFTGGEPAGLAIHRALAGRPQVLLALEMGGNNPIIAWEVDDVAAAASQIVFSAFVSAGQRCTCARRLIIPEGVAGDDLLAAVIAQTKSLSIGDPLAEPSPFMGSLIHAKAATDFKAARTAIIQQGAGVLYDDFAAENGAFVSPSMVDVTGIAVPDEELFGPFLQVTRVADFEQALQAANQTRFGLAAALLSSRAELFEPFQQTVRAGILNVNQPTAGASGAAPFGGIGLSGNHRPAGFYAADYCAYPVASLSADLHSMTLPGAKTA